MRVWNHKVSLVKCCRHVCVKQTVGLILCHISRNDKDEFRLTWTCLNVWLISLQERLRLLSLLSLWVRAPLTPPWRDGIFPEYPSMRARPSIVQPSWDPAWSLTASVSPHPDDRNRPAIPPQGQIKEERNRKRYSQKFSFINLFL